MKNLATMLPPALAEEAIEAEFGEASAPSPVEA